MGLNPADSAMSLLIMSARVSPVLRQAVDVVDTEVRSLRAVIAKAIDDLGPHTMVHNYDSGDECDDCCDDWPCRYARVADDLRKAIEP